MVTMDIDLTPPVPGSLNYLVLPVASSLERLHLKTGYNLFCIFPNFDDDLRIYYWILPREASREALLATGHFILSG